MRSFAVLINDLIVAFVWFLRRINPKTRDKFDRLFQKRIAAVAQKLINFKRKNEHLALAEEKLLPNEEEITRQIIKEMNFMLKKRYNTRIAYRAGNTKTYGLVTAEFEVLPELSDDLRVGVFKEARIYPAWLRFGGPGPENPPDPKDNGILSISIKLMGVAGEKLIDDEKMTQDFLGISSPTFTTPNIIENLKLQKQVTKGTPIFYFINPFDSHFLDGIMQGIYAKNHSSPLDLQYYSCVPYLFGAGRAIHYSFKPQSNDKTPVPKDPGDQYLREAMVNTLDQKDVYFDFMIQFQTDPHQMPIENAAVVWPEAESPFIKVATIRIPAQEFATRARDDFARNLSFNPWHSLPEHRPLGNQNRARKYIYLETSKYRQQLSKEVHIEPTEASYSSKEVTHEQSGTNKRAVH